MNLVCQSCRRHHMTCDCPGSVRRSPLVPDMRAAAPVPRWATELHPILTGGPTQRITTATRPMPEPPRDAA